MRFEIALCLPRDAETVAVARDMVVAMLHNLGVTTDCIEDIRLALSEACTNVIEHAHATDEYEVQLVVDDDRCAIEVTDAGHGFDPERVDGHMPPPRSPDGRGLALMQALVDRVDFTSEPKAGTIVHLVKRLTLVPDSPLHQFRLA